MYIYQPQFILPLLFVGSQISAHSLRRDASRRSLRAPYWLGWLTFPSIATNIIDFGQIGVSAPVVS